MHNNALHFTKNVGRRPTKGSALLIQGLLCRPKASFAGLMMASPSWVAFGHPRGFASQRSSFGGAGSLRLPRWPSAIWLAFGQPWAFGPEQRSPEGGSLRDPGMGRRPSQDRGHDATTAATTPLAEGQKVRSRIFGKKEC